MSSFPDDNPADSDDVQRAKAAEAAALQQRVANMHLYEARDLDGIGAEYGQVWLPCRLL